MSLLIHMVLVCMCNETFENELDGVFRPNWMGFFKSNLDGGFRTNVMGASEGT